MENLVGVLIGGLIAAVAGLIGLSISKKTEHSQWLRDQKLEVYSEVSAHLERLLHSATHQIHLGMPTTDNHLSAGQALEASRQVSRLMMIAPENVIHYALEAQKAVFALVGINASQFKAAEGNTINALAMLNVHVRMDLQQGQEQNSLLTSLNRYFSRNLRKRS